MNKYLQCTYVRNTEKRRIGLAFFSRFLEQAFAITWTYVEVIWRYSIHEEWKLEYRGSLFNLLFFYNGSGYDSRYL